MLFLRVNIRSIIFPALAVMPGGDTGDVEVNWEGDYL